MQDRVQGSLLSLTVWKTDGGLGRRPSGTTPGGPSVESTYDGAGPRPGGTLATVGLVLVIPLVLLGWLVPGARDLDQAVLAYELVVYPAVLAAGLLLYVSWRISRRSLTGWLAAGVTLVGGQGLGLAGVHAARRQTFLEHLGWVAAIDLTVQATILLLIVLAPRVRMAVDPFLAGLAMAAVVTTMRVLALELPPLTPAAVTLRGLACLLFIGQVAAAVLLVRLPELPPWVFRRVAEASVTLGLSQLVLTPGLYDDATAVLATALSVAGATLLLDTALALLQDKVRRQTTTVRGLHDRVEHLEAGVRGDRERLHEIGATIAGIASASQLLHDHPGLPPTRRHDLERAIGAEAARLQRLMDGRHRTRFEESDLDAVLEPLVTAHRTRGRVVHWEPGHLKVRCRPDDIAEVVNILLENAAQHGRSDCTLTTRRTPETVEVVVSDHGPGVPADLAPHIFTWGRRGAGSSGQGIGLHIAHRLMVEQGGDLHLEEARPGEGATFVACLPAERVVEPRPEGSEPSQARD